MSDADLLAVMTLRSVEQGMRKRASEEPTAFDREPEQSDKGDRDWNRHYCVDSDTQPRLGEEEAKDSLRYVHRFD